MNEHEVKVFTLAEANQLLPVLSALLVSLQEIRAYLSDLEIQIDAHELVSEKGSQNAARESNRLIGKYRKAGSQFQEMVEEIHSHGCFLKDLDLGLIDFFWMRDDRIVCLCWRFGEEEIGFWHDTKTGYADRQPI